MLFEALSFTAVLPDTWGVRGSDTIVAVAYTAVGSVLALRPADLGSLNAAFSVAESAAQDPSDLGVSAPTRVR